MKQFFQRSMAFFLAFVVLMTTSSFAVDIHYCGDTLVDFSFVQQVEKCDMEKALANTNNADLDVSVKSCCTDKQLVKEGQDDLKVSFNTLTLEQHIFVATFMYSYISLFEATESTAVPYVDYAPPFIKRDVQALHQTFLI